VKTSTSSASLSVASLLSKDSLTIFQVKEKLGSLLASFDIGLLTGLKVSVKQGVLE
jgi:hypothetical protein